MVTWLIWLSALGMWASGCQKSDPVKHTLIAKLGNEEVSLEELRDAYEVDPAFPSIRKGEAGLRDYLEEVLDKKAALKRAEKNRVFNQQPFKQRLEYETRKAIVKDYYQRKVARKIRITDDELRYAYQLSSTKFTIKLVRVQAEQTAAALRLKLDSGISFDSLKLAIPEAVVTEQEVDGGLLEENLQLLWPGGQDQLVRPDIMNFKAGEIRGPFQSEHGYYFIQLLNREETMMLTESDFLTKKEALIRNLKRRKEEKAAGNYLVEVLGPMDIKVQRQSLELFYHDLMGEISGIRRNPQLEAKQFLSDDQLARVRKQLTEALEMPVVTSRSLNWTMKEFLEYLEQLPEESRPGTQSLTRFTNDLGGLIRDEILSRMAKSESDQWKSTADSSLNRIKTEWAYHYYLEKIFHAYELPLEIADYYERRLTMNPLTDTVPAGILPGMNQPEIYRWYYSKKKLHNDLMEELPDQKIWINDSLMTAESGRINWKQPLRMVISTR